MKKYGHVFLLVCMASSSLVIGGCVKKAAMIKSVIVAGIGVATAVLGDQVSASKRVGVPNRRRRRTKKSKNVFIKSPESISIRTTDETSSREGAQK